MKPDRGGLVTTAAITTTNASACGSRAMASPMIAVSYSVVEALLHMHDL